MDRIEEPTSGERLTVEDLAAWTETTPEQIAALAEAGALRPGPDGHFEPGDVHRVRLLDAFQSGGIPLDALIEAQRRGQVSFAFYDQLHRAPARPSHRTHGELLAELGPERADLVRRWLAATGLAEPGSDERWPSDEEALLLETIEVLAAIEPVETALRIARLQGEAARRAAEGALTAYGDWVRHLAEIGKPLAADGSAEPRLTPWGRYARFAPTLAAWVHARHLSSEIDAFSVEETERFLERSGFIAPRPERPPAVAFVDVSGFTRLSEEHGDEFAARTAATFGELADRIARAHRGRVVKLLGDGVLLHFASPGDAVEAALALLSAMPTAGLPPGHAGVHAGPVVVREGDIFGRTVNVASRIADVAGPGELLASAAAIASLDDERFAFEHIGPQVLAGVPQPIPVARVVWKR